jgi:Fe-S-cluster containining protein
MQDSKPQVNHDSIVDDWQQNAKARDDKNYEFLRSMKFRDHGFEPDELAGQLHEKTFQIVDCTRCANCCKTMDIKFDDEDVKRIAGHLDIEIDEFIQTYLEHNDEDGPYEVRGKPCSFLGEDGHCNIYDVRPSVCREYPHTDKDGFTFRTMSVANNALVCPAVFWIVEEMKKRSGYGRRSGKKRH